MKWHEGHRSCREEGGGTARSVTNCEAPEGHCSFANTIKEHKETYWQCCNGLAHLLADDENDEHLITLQRGSC